MKTHHLSPISYLPILSPIFTLLILKRFVYQNSASAIVAKKLLIATVLTSFLKGCYYFTPYLSTSCQINFKELWDTSLNEFSKT